MKFNVDTTTPFNSGSRYDSSSERGHKLDHSERYYGSKPNRDDYDTEEAYKEAVKKHNRSVDYKRKNVNPKLSKYNFYKDNILSGKSVYNNLYSRYYNYCMKHDVKQIKQGRLNRCYGSLNQKLSDKSKNKYIWSKDPTKEYLKTRWLKPIRTLPFKLGNEKEKYHLINFCQSHGMSYETYTKAINQGYLNYVKDFNAHNKYIKITNIHTNLDEKGGDHAHMDYLALARTKSGRLSLSFNNAMKLSLSNYKGSDPLYKHPARYNRHDLASAFVSKQVNSLHVAMNKSFKANGLDIQFTQVSHMHKGQYIKDLSTWQHMKDANRMMKKSNITLKKANASALKQNSNLKQEVTNLKRKVIPKGTIQEADKSSIELMNQNDTLRSRNSKLKNRNSKLVNELKKANQYNSNLSQRYNHQSRLINKGKVSLKYYLQLITKSKGQSESTFTKWLHKHVDLQTKKLKKDVKNHVAKISMPKN